MSLNWRKLWSGEGTGSCWTTLVLISGSGPSSSLICSRQMWERQIMESRGRTGKRNGRKSQNYPHSKISRSKSAVYVLSLYQNVDMVAKSSPPVFDPEYVSKAGTESTSLQTRAGNSTHHCLPVPTWKALRTKRKALIKYSNLIPDERVNGQDLHLDLKQQRRFESCLQKQRKPAGSKMYLV